jgi:hypothetical protein
MKNKMKKFSEIKKINKKIFEADNLPMNIEEPKLDVTPNIEMPTEFLGEGSTPGKLFSKLFESREMAHIYHLQVKGDMGSHAKHTALGDYYEGVLVLIDSIIEAFQGQYGIIEEYDVIDTSGTREKDTIEYFNELARFIKEERKCINEEDTHLHNIIDEVVALVYRTLYKLKYTK